MSCKNIQVNPKKSDNSKLSVRPVHLHFPHKDAAETADRDCAVYFALICRGPNAFTPKLLIPLERE